MEFKNASTIEDLIKQAKGIEQLIEKSKELKPYIN